MVQNIYLIRHGETQWNKNRRFQGSMDIELNEVGQGQAEKLQKAMMTVHLDRLVTSNLQRARQTAEILNKPHHLTIDIDEGFREIHFGLWEGLSFEQVKSQYPNEADLWMSDPVLLRIPEGETFQQLTDRVWDRFLYWTNRQDYQNMAIVSHGGTCAALICKILNEPVSFMWKYVQANTAINLVERNQLGEYLLKAHNDQAHLV